MTAKYRPHSVRRHDRPDGTIILRSGYDMTPPVAKTTDWLDHWAATTPEALYLAERAGPGWRELTYAEARDRTRALAAGLLGRGIGPGSRLLVLSGNSVDHALLTLAAQLIGAAIVPVAEQYSLIPDARKQLDFIAALIRPDLVFAEDGGKFGPALARDALAGIPQVTSRATPDGATGISTLMQGDSADVDAAAARVTPESVVKILMTSGSTSNPKGVETTHAMMCANQAQIADALPFLRARPPRLVDWLPWNHVFGGSHNFNLVLANGGSLHIDAGKPVRPLIDISIENLSMVTATLAFNVPVGFALLRDAMRDNPALKRRYFEDLDMLFYAGASLPQDIWADLEAMAREVRGDMPLFTSSWGLTETAPATLIQHEPTERSGIVGVPMTGTEIKLIPDADMRCEVRVRGPNIFRGYLGDPERSAAAFDDEGFFLTGDAMKFVDPDDMTKGLCFDGRISEDFKLSSGTWVRAANLRLSVLERLGQLAADVVICGADRDEIGLLVIPGPAAQATAPTPDDGLLTGAALEQALRAALGPSRDEGSSTRIRRVAVLADPPSMAEGEITAKGNLNFRKLLALRAGLCNRLYAVDDPAVTLL